jgi:hypothetical protein
MSLWPHWLCIFVLIGSGIAEDVPFVFDKNVSSVANYTPVQLERSYISSPDLVGVPPVTIAADNVILNVPIVGGGRSRRGTNESTVEYYRKLFDSRVEPNNTKVHALAVAIVADHPGDHTINQVNDIFDYLIAGDKKNHKRGWSYVGPPRGVNNFVYANDTITQSENKDYVGAGDCGAFAILMSALVESVDGTTRIILANNNTTGGHAYVQVYIGRDDIPNSETEDIIKYLMQEFDTDKIFTNIETDTKDVWLNLDWWPDQKGDPHPGGPFFPGDENIVTHIRVNYPKTVLLMPEKLNDPPQLISLTPNKTSPQEVGTAIAWTTMAKDRDNDPIFYRFFLNDNPVTNWTEDKIWVWPTNDTIVGENQIEVHIRDGKYGHARLNGFDGRTTSSFNVTKANSEMDWIKIGNELKKLGNYLDAIQAYDNAIKLNPRSFEAWTDKGNAFDSLGRYEEAILAYGKALEIYPNYDRAKAGKELASYTQSNALYEASKPKGIPPQETNDNWIPGYHWPGM